MSNRTSEYISIVVGMLTVAISGIAYYPKIFISIGIQASYFDSKVFKSLALYPSLIIVALSTIGLSFGLYYSVGQKKISIGMLINAAILIINALSKFAGYYIRETT